MRVVRILVRFSVSNTIKNHCNFVVAEPLLVSLWIYQLLGRKVSMARDATIVFQRHCYVSRDPFLSLRIPGIKDDSFEDSILT